MEITISNILIQLFIIGSVINLLFSRNSNILSCGIFGFSGREGKKANIKKLQALGLYNIQRGTDSCGYYYNGNLVKGIDDEANFSKFISQNKLTPGDLIGETFMGHTRKSTSGLNTAPNAHPHKIDNYIQTHNGVIKNIWSLCNKRGVDHSQITVDSIGLGHLIHKFGFEILNEYEGYAALAMTWMDDPTSLYLYHGASKETEKGVVFEERPLFILETAEGIYYSSMEESLKFINESKKKPYCLPHNYVYRITNGKFTNFDYEVFREEKNVKIPTYYGNVCNMNSLPFYKKEEKEVKTTAPDKEIENTAKTILHETLPIEQKIQGVYFHRGRFYNIKNHLLHGEYFIDRDGDIIDMDNVSFNTHTPEQYYFFRGVMMKSKKALDSYLKESVTLDSNFAFYISKYSKYPVANLENEGFNAMMRWKWYNNTKIYSGSFKTKFGDRTYTISGGDLKKISKYSNEEIIFNDTIDVNRADLLDSESIKKEPVDKLLLLIREWSAKKIKKDDLDILPEAFLMFIDFFNSKFALDNTSEKDIEMETEIVLSDMCKAGYTFDYYLDQLRESDFLSKENIVECFKDYEYEEVLLFDNRFLFDSSIIEELEYEDVLEQGDITIDAFGENKELSQGLEFLEDAVSQLSALEDNADLMQAVDNDLIQDVTKVCYDGITDIKRKVLSLLDTSKNEKVNTIKQKLNNIKVC